MASMFGPYASYIISSYTITGMVVLGLVVWVIADGRRQKAMLRDLEARGVSRRSGAA